MKRVLCVIASLNTGGAETFLMKILRSIDKENYMLDFIVSEEGIYDKEAKLFGSKIYKVDFRTKHPIKVFNEIRNIVRKNNYDYFLKLCNTPMGILDVLAAKIGGANWISVRSCNASTNSTKAEEFVYSVIRPIFNRTVDCKIAPSYLAAQYTFGEKEAHNNVHKLNNGVDVKTYKFNPAERRRIREQYGIDDKDILVGHIGRFSKQKNHDYILRIFAECQNRNKNSVLMLVGTGERINEIKEKVDALGLFEKVIFTGVRTDIPDVLAAMDCFILPSLFEGMPNTAIEAQASGLKCLLADTITNEAKITDLVSYLPLSESVDSWVNAILSVNPNTDRGEYAEKLITEGYDIRCVNKEFVSLVFHE